MSGKREQSNRSKRGGSTTMPNPTPWVANDDAEMHDALGQCVGVMGCAEEPARPVDVALAVGVVARVNLFDALMGALRNVLMKDGNEPLAAIGIEIAARRVLREAEGLGALGALGGEGT